MTSRPLQAHSLLAFAPTQRGRRSYPKQSEFWYGTRQSKWRGGQTRFHVATGLRVAYGAGVHAWLCNNSLVSKLSCEKHNKFAQRGPWGCLLALVPVLLLDLGRGRHRGV